MSMKEDKLRKEIERTWWMYIKLNKNVGAKNSPVPFLESPLYLLQALYLTCSSLHVLNSFFITIKCRYIYINLTCGRALFSTNENELVWLLVGGSL